MLHRRNDEMPAATTMRQAIPLDGQVVGLRTAAGEKNLIHMAAEQLGDLSARLLHRLFGLQPKPMSA